MSVYKDLSQRDVNIREFYAYKEFTFDETDDDIRVQWCNRDTSIYYPFPEFTPVGSGGFVGRTLYDSIKHLYYHKDYILEYSSSNLYTGVVNTPTVDSGGNALPWSLITTIYDPYHNFGPNYSQTYKNLGDSAVVISVPQKYFGERMKPGTVYVEDVTEGFELIDDGKGNLYDQVYSASFSTDKRTYTVGNIFYEHGNIVVTGLGSHAGNFVEFSSSIESGSQYVLVSDTTRTYIPSNPPLPDSDPVFYFSTGSAVSESMGNLVSKINNSSASGSVSSSIYFASGTLLPSTMVLSASDVGIVGNSYTFSGSNCTVFSGSNFTGGLPIYTTFGTGSNDIVVKFKSTEKLYELEAVCTAKEGEFNFTMNPSARVGRSLLTSEPLGFVSSSEFTTYPTTIGLYNNDGYLVAVGKVAQPIRNDSELALTIVTRLYW